MTTRLDPTWQSEGLAVTLQVDGSETLTDLTRAVSAICDQIENRHEKSVAIIEISDARAEEREWPGDVSIQAVNRWERAVRRLENLSAVSIASVGGTCGGPSLDLFLAADYESAHLICGWCSHQRRAISGRACPCATGRLCQAEPAAGHDSDMPGQKWPSLMGSTSRRSGVPIR